MTTMRMTRRHFFLSWERPTPAGLLRLLLLMAGIESNPGPSSTLPSHGFSTVSTSLFNRSAPISSRPSSSTPTPFRVMQFNINGLAGKIMELVHFLVQNDIMVAAIQESKLNSRSRLPRCPGYTVIRKDRERDRGGGLAFLVRDTLQFRLFDVPPSPNPTQEQQAIAVKSGDGELKIINVYIPPV